MVSSTTVVLDETVVGSFPEWARDAEPRLSQALIASFGSQLGEEAAAEALAFAWIIGVVSIAWLLVTTNALAAGLALAAILFYVFVYTLVLKRRTEQNIVWGGIAGCFPVLIGWSAVTGSLESRRHMVERGSIT